MKRKMAFISLLIVISGMAIFLLGCPPPVVRVRPPEARVEVYGPPPHPEAVWIPGYWRHGRGEWIWVPGYWESLMPFGCLATGRQEGEVGSGIKDVGSIGEKKTVRSWELGVRSFNLTNQKINSKDF